MNREVDRRWPRCVHLAGVDGVGKTTQARATLSLMRDDGIRVQHVWLRFPRLFCAPLLAYARLRGYSHQETAEGHKHGYWHFHRSWVMSTVFPWVLLLDSWLAALIKVYLPLWRGHTVVCDRFVIDILADLMAGLGDASLDERKPGRLFIALLPRGTRVAILDLDTYTARLRCPELRGDRSHAQRRHIYLDLARRHHLQVVSADAPVDTVTDQLVEAITKMTSVVEPGG